MRPRVLLLDLDGPVLDVRARYFAAHQRAAAGLSSRMLDLPMYWDAKRRRASVAEILGVGDDRPCVAEYRLRWREAIEAPDLLALDTLQPSAAEALGRLVVFPQRVLVSMRSWAAGLWATLHRLAVTTFFTRVEVVPHAVGSKLEAFRACGTPARPADTVVIGDTEVDLDAAQRLHFPAIGVSEGIRTAEWLRAFSPAAVVPDLLTAAEFLLRGDERDPTR